MCDLEFKISDYCNDLWPRSIKNKTYRFYFFFFLWVAKVSYPNGDSDLYVYI